MAICVATWAPFGVSWRAGLPSSIVCDEQAGRLQHGHDVVQLGVVVLGHGERVAHPCSSGLPRPAPGGTIAQTREVTRHGPSAMADLDRPAGIGGSHVRVSSASLPRSGRRAARGAGPGAGTVYAAIPNGNGTYYACYVKNTGAVRLINYPKVKHLSGGEKLIKWSATGTGGAGRTRRAKGEQGPKGDQGAQGRPGTGRGIRLLQLGRHRQQARGPRRRPDRLG